MVMKQQVDIIDDLDGTVIPPEDYTGPLEFGLGGGVTYEIDLTPTNRGELLESMSAYVKAARRLRPIKAPKPVTSKVRSPAKPHATTASTPVAIAAPAPTAPAIAEPEATPPAVVAEPVVPAPAPAPVAAATPRADAPRVTAPRLNPQQEAELSRRAREWALGRTFNVGGKQRTVSPSGPVPAWAKARWREAMMTQSQDLPEQQQGAKKGTAVGVPEFSG